MKWNPHIHCLLSEGGVADNGKWRNVTHFNYTYLRNAFRTVLLNELEQRITSPSFKRIKSACYREHKYVFYVYAKPNKCEPKTVIKYIGRYLGRPVIATSRIDKYDGENVTFHYNRHEDDKYIEETIPALEFIEKLIQHIPERNFKMIRYYGVYARHRKSDDKLRKAINPDLKRYLINRNKWRNNIFRYFGYDPLCCSKCSAKMVYLELRYNHKHVSLEEMYNKVMAKARLPAN